MQILKEKDALRKQVRSFKKEAKTIGFVPTMGALHEGHLSLIHAALRACDKVIVSIFVNPTQFDNPEDLQKYPRSLSQDIEFIEKISRDVIIFSPSAEEIYGNHISSQNFDFAGLENKMEGKFRDGHFNGVGTVVKKLFEAVEPDKAFFGEKDYQQLQIIKKMVAQQGIDIEIIGCPISREENGLARSSRNERLSPFQRESAGFIYQTLLKVKEDFGTKSASEIKAWVLEKFKEQPDLHIEYFEISRADNLEPIADQEKNQQYRAFIAVYSGSTRLIDNIALN